MRNEFLGATGTVTRSKYLLEHEGRWLLVDVPDYRQSVVM